MERLDLSNNNIRDIGYALRDLPRLREVNLSCNGLEHVSDWHLRIGNIKRLNIAKNSVRALHGWFGIDLMLGFQCFDRPFDNGCQVVYVCLSERRL